MTESSRKSQEKGRLGQTLRKEERLHEKAAIEMVFRKGNSIYHPPVKLLWVANKEKHTVPVRAAFSVPKRIFKKAVTRNLLKRRMREAYRKNKVEVASGEVSYALVFIYTGQKINPYAEIESKILLTLQHFKTAIGAE
jgi:ribonuclease P protein component